MNNTAMLAIDGETMRLIRERCEVLKRTRGVERVPFRQYVRELVAADVAAAEPAQGTEPCHQ